MEPPLLSRVADGEAEAVRLCVERYQGLIWSLARGFFRDSAEAEDTVQDVFIELWKNAHRFDPARGKESTFVGVLARRRMIDKLRKLNRRPTTSSIDLDPESDQESTEQRMERGEDALAAREVLRSLPEQQRQAIELAVLHGFTHQQVCEKLDIPLGTVKAHVRRGLQRLRDRLGSANSPAGGRS